MRIRKREGSAFYWHVALYHRNKVESTRVSGGVHGIVLFCAPRSFLQVQNNIMLVIEKDPAHSV